MNNKELRAKLNNVPPHTGWSLPELEGVLSHYQDVWGDISRAFNSNEITEPEYLGLKADVLRGTTSLSNRIKALVGKDQEEVKKKKARDLLTNLNITYAVTHEDSVKITDLYDIFTDEVKLKALVSRMKMKAFW